MSSGTLKTVGVLLHLGDGASPEVFTKVSNLKSLSGNGQAGTRSDIDVTDLDSTTREYLAGLADLDEVTFQVMQITSDSVHQSLETIHGSGVLRGWRVILPSSPTITYEFQGFVKNISSSYEIDNVVVQDITVRPNQRASRS